MSTENRVSTDTLGRYNQTLHVLNIPNSYGVLTAISYLIGLFQRLYGIFLFLLEAIHRNCTRLISQTDLVSKDDASLAHPTWALRGSFGTAASKKSLLAPNKRGSKQMMDVAVSSTDKQDRGIIPQRHNGSATTHTIHNKK